MRQVYGSIVPYTTPHYPLATVHDDTFFATNTTRQSHIYYLQQLEHTPTISPTWCCIDSNERSDNAQCVVQIDIQNYYTKNIV